MLLDAVRRKAHHAASQVGDGVNYNPFARTRPRGSSVDVEGGVHRTRSEANIEPIIEEQRRLESRNNQQEFPPPHHAGTAPPVSPTSAGGSETAHGTVGEKDLTPVTNGGPNKESADISDHTAVANSAGVTKRAKFKNIFRKDHEGEEHTELDHVDSEEVSLEERKRRSHKRRIPVGQQIHAVLFSSWINVLLVFVPVGFALYYSKKVGAVPIFIVNFVAIIPLAAMLSYATEELAIRVGETLGGLLNATFGYVCATGT